MAEILISPDRRSVAIRSVYAETPSMEFGVFHQQHGGHWAAREELQDWVPLDSPPAEDPL